MGDHLSGCISTTSLFAIVLLVFLPLHLHLHLIPSQAASELVFEYGYTVSTFLDGDKSNIKVNPHSILHQSPPSDFFILLDSVASTFYTVTLHNRQWVFPTNKLTRKSSELNEIYDFVRRENLHASGLSETALKRLAGNGQIGYVDGDLDSAKFNKSESFAVDSNGNVYVANFRNHAIRKITKSGVTTIAGGYSQKKAERMEMHATHPFQTILS